MSFKGIIDFARQRSSMATDSSSGNSSPTGSSQDTLSEFWQSVIDLKYYPGFSISVFNKFLTKGELCSIPSTEMASYRGIILRLKKEACGENIYYIDGQFYLSSALSKSFPEFEVFKLTVKDSFLETAFNKIFIETERFARLRSLSRMRQEIKSMPRSKHLQTVEMVKQLLQID